MKVVIEEINKFVMVPENVSDEAILKHLFTCSDPGSLELTSIQPNTNDFTKSINDQFRDHGLAFRFYKKDSGD